MKDKKLFHFRYIFYPFLAFLFGLAIARRLFAGEILPLVLVCLLFVVYTIFMISYRKWKSLVILLVFFLLGNGFYFIGTATTFAKDYEGENIVIGRVTDDLEQYYNSSYTAVLEDVYINGEPAKNVYVTIKIKNGDEIKPGDKLTFKAELETAKYFDFGNFNSFYLRNDIGYLASTDTSSCEIIGSSLAFDESLRLRVKELLNENMSEDNAGLCYAVLFGDKSDVDYMTKTYYQNAGVIHVLTVSGLHVGFLIALIYFILRKLRLGRIPTTIITSIILLLFNILCGFAPSVMRASLMALIMMLAKLSGREYDNLNSLGLAGFIILLIKPLYAYDVGFLMSFACVASIFLLYKPISNIFKRVMPDKLAEYLALSISAQIGILPFLSTFQSSVNILSFFANLLIVPLFSILYPLLMVSIILILIIPAIGKLLWIFDKGFDLATMIAHFFADTSMQVPLLAYDLSLVMFIFLIMFLTSAFTIMKKPAKFISASVMTILLVISVLVNYLPRRYDTSFYTFNNASTECVMMISDSGQKVIIYNEINEKNFKNGLKSENINEIDYIITENLPSKQELDFWSGYNVKKFISLAGEGTSDIIAMEENQPLQVGDFQIEYVSDGKVFGFELNFDDASIFVASFVKDCYNEINNTTLDRFSLVYNYGDIYYKNNGAVSETSYADMGNLAFNLSSGGSKFWRLD